MAAFICLGKNALLAELLYSFLGGSILARLEVYRKMSYTPTETELGLRKTLVEVANLIAETSLESLVQRDKFGIEGGFVPCGPLFAKTKLLFKSLAEADLDLASETKLNALLGITNEILTQFGNFRNFSPRGVPNPADQRSNLMNSYRQVYDQAYDRIAPVLSLSQREKMAASQSDASRLLAEISTIKDTATKEIAETIARVREVAKETGIVEHARLFKDEADKHDRMSIMWLVATVLLGAATGVFGWINYSRTLEALQALVSAPPLPQGTTSPAGITAFAIQLAVAKLIGFSILFSAVLWTGRVYRAHRHNCVVNRHRQNALGTFEVFVKAASADDQTKNAVLLQATQCIFSPQSTGYLAAEKELEGSAQMVEIIRNIPPAK